MPLHISRFKLEKPFDPRKASEYIQKRSVVTDGGCWQWTKFSNGLGYGHACMQGVKWMAHRLSWVIHRGPIPVNMFVCHKCDTPSCVNPSHLFLGSHTDNQRDMVAKGRHTKQRTHCIRGHELAGANLFISTEPNGSRHRHCKACCRERQKRRYHASEAVRALNRANQRKYQARKREQRALATSHKRPKP